MSIFKKLFRREPKSPEDLAAEAESRQLRDQMETQRLSQRSQAGQNYQSGRGTRQ